MKYSITLVIIVINLIVLSAQDLRWSFEDWEMIDSIESPLGWDINHQLNNADILVARFYKDSIDVVDGLYSLRAEKDSLVATAWSNCNSIAEWTQDLESPISANQSFYFNVKSESLNSLPEVYVKVVVTFLDDSGFLGRVEWISYEEANEWQDIELPIPFDGGTEMSIKINAASQNGGLDDCNLISKIWIDDMRIGESSVNNSNSLGFEDVLMYPNPTNGVVHFKNLKPTEAYYTVTDVIGKVLQEGELESNRISLQATGLNIIRIESNDGQQLVLKVFNLGDQ